MADVLAILLRELGLTHNYKSYRRTATSIQLGIENEERLEAITKEIYPETARICGCSWSAVERSLRTSIDIIWRTNPKYLSEIAGYPLAHRPSAGQFIEIIVIHIRTNGGKDDI